MITIELKDNSKKIDLELATQKHLKSIVEVIKDDITKNLTSERTVTSEFYGAYGAPKPLSSKYLKWKVQKGYPKNIYQMQGNLIKSVQSKKNNEYSYTIKIGGKANKYAGYVNNIRRFFGISKSILDKLENDFKKLKLN